MTEEDYLKFTKRQLAMLLVKQDILIDKLINANSFPNTTFHPPYWSNDWPNDWSNGWYNRGVTVDKSSNFSTGDSSEAKSNKIGYK